MGAAQEYSGFLTPEAFRDGLGGLLKELRAFFSSDVGPFDPADSRLSPGGFSVHFMSGCEYAGEPEPGVLGVKASAELTSLSSNQVVGRIGFANHEALIAVSQIVGGLRTDGADELETYQTFRLVNRGLPRTVF